jgi:hypothetical protein
MTTGIKPADLLITGTRESASEKALLVYKVNPTVICLNSLDKCIA